MKRFLFKKVDGFAWIAILILSLCGFTTASAEEGATSDQINAAIVNSPVPVTWVNDADYPWEIGYSHNYIYCDKLWDKNKSTTITATFTIDKYSRVYTYCLEPNGDGEINLYFDGILKEKKTDFTYTNYCSTNVVLPPGKHTIEYECRSYYGSSIFSITELVIDQQWDEIRVDYPGDFKDKVYDLVNGLGDRTLNLLKISGTINSEDLQSLREYTKNNPINENYVNEYGMWDICGIDLSDTDIIDIPEFYFSRYDDYNIISAAFNSLSAVIFPETLKSIGPCAFYKNLNIFQIHIPSSVERIAYEAFCESSLTSISFGNNPRLKRIEGSAFYSTNLQELIIPKTVKEIGKSAFSSCSQLKKVTLNSHTNNLDGTFSDCAALDTIILSSVTPPTIIATNDPFNKVNKNNITLLVPDFAVDSYKSDTYWSQFTGVKASPEISKSDFWAIHGYVKQSEEQKFTGTPSIELECGGVLDIAENTTLALDEVIFSNEDSNPPCFFNMSNGVTMNNIATRFEVPAGKTWYFFSPATDVNMSDITFSTQASWVIRSYDGERRASENNASGNWKNVPANGTLKCGQGYVVQATSAGFLNMPAKDSGYGVFLGTENADMTLSDYTSETVENTGWNLVANPYPTFYDSRRINCEAPITVWTGSTYRSFSLADDAYVLRPLQPFFVQKYTDDVSFEMPRDGRQYNNNVKRSDTQRIREEGADRDFLNIEINRVDCDEADDYTRIVINEAASMSYEGNRDAIKFMSMDADVAQIYSLGENSNRMAINERPYSDGNAALGVYVPNIRETYCISASRIDRNAWLYDGVSGYEHDLTEGDYFFTADKSGFDESRFSIRFAPSAETSVGVVEHSPVKVLPGIGQISVCSPEGAEVLVVCADGRIIANELSDGGLLEIPAPAGVYVVKVNGKGYKAIVKR